MTTEQDNPTNPFRTIVGVVDAVKFFTPSTGGWLEVYSDAAEPQQTLFVRTASEPGATIETIRHEIRAVDPELPLPAIRTMDQLVHSSAAEPRFQTVLFGTFAAVALLLAAIGIYGVASFAVTQRKQEIAIRMVCGALPSDVVCLVLRQCMIPVVVGTILGIVAALGLTHLLTSFLFEVTPTDLGLGVFIAVPLVLAAVALLANLIPVFRGTKLDPILYLKYE